MGDPQGNSGSAGTDAVVLVQPVLALFHPSSATFKKMFSKSITVSLMTDFFFYNL